MPATEPTLHHLLCADPRGLHRMAWWDWPCTGPAGAAAPVAVCVHGLTRQGRDFDALARALQPTHRVVCPDVVGRGRSDRLSDPAGYGLPTYAADLVALLGRLAVGPVDWVGTSMGGLIGMVVGAMRDGRGQGLIRRLVLNDVGPVLAPQAIARIGDYVGERPSFASLDEGVAWLRNIGLGFGPHSEADWRALSLHQLLPERLRDTPPAEAAALRAGEAASVQPRTAADDPQAAGPWTTQHDPAIALPFRAIGPQQVAAVEAWLWSCYERLDMPTLLLRGAESDLLSPETAQAMTQRGPRARRVDFAGVGHAPTLVDPAQQAQVIDFLRAV